MEKQFPTFEVYMCQKWFTKCPITREIFKGDNNPAAAVVKKLEPKTNKSALKGSFIIPKYP